MGIETHSDYITGSYATDVQYVLEVAENNPLRKDPTLANLGPQLDTVGSVFIGYGYDLLQNAAGGQGLEVVAALQNAGATITDPTGLANLLDSLSPGPVTPADVQDIASYISVPNTPTAISDFATTLLDNTISTKESALTNFLGTLGITIPDSSERVALMDMYYQAPGGSGHKNGYFEFADGSFTNLSLALQSGNRAEAWFEIRYQSADSGAQGTGIVARRYMDAQLFSLYANPSAPTQTETLQAYQMLTANRSTIMSYEARFGSDPYGSGALAPSGEIAAANQNYGLTGTANQVQTLAQAFDPAAQEEVTYLDSLYSSVLPVIGVNDTGSSVFDTFNLRSVDFYAASPTDPLVYAGVSDAPTSAEQLADASADHILLGSETGDTLIGAAGNDILVGQAGNELLEAGTGSDTLIADAGNDTIQAAGTSDVMDFVFPATSGYKETVEMNGGTGTGALYVNGSSIDGNLSSLGNDTWTGNGDTYTFIANPSDLPPGYSPGAGAPAVGELQILVGGQGGNEIDIWGFNLTAAEYSAGGYLGISLAPSISITSGATAGVDPPAPDFTAGSSQSYTVSVDAPSTSAQTVTLTLSGAPASDFGLGSGTSVIPINSDGTFTVTIAAGQTSASFSLVNTGDVGGNASLQLTASLTNPSDPTGPAITSTPLTQSYVEPTPDPFVNNATSTVTGTPAGDPDISFDNYATGNSAGQSEQVVLSGGNNYVIEHGENDLITEAAPSNNIIIGSTFSSSNEILLNGASTVAQAIAQATAGGTASGQLGDVVATGDGDDTIVGGDGNSAYLVGAGNNVIYTGAGNDTVWAGYLDPSGVGTYVDQFNWSAPVTVYAEFPFTYGNTTIDVPAYTISDTSVGGLSETLTGSATGSDTVIAGNGNDVIALPDGPNYVVGGTGNDTILGGNGGNTIFAGSGTDTIEGGTGSDYYRYRDGQ